MGFEKAGLECRWQVEKKLFCQKVLTKHWPNVGRWDDVQTFPPAPAEDWSVDIICGGFPCQDISNAGKRKGIEGSQSRLWYEFAKIIRILRPQIVVVENVAILTKRGLCQVLGDLAESGYDAEWSVFPCCALGAPHTRERMFIVAHTHRGKKRVQCGWMQREKISHKKRDLHNWQSQSTPTRVADGIPNRLDRNSAIGNAVCPHIAEYIGKKIIQNFQE